jgi:hypothetical protein
MLLTARAVTLCVLLLYVVAVLWFEYRQDGVSITCAGH